MPKEADQDRREGPRHARYVAFPSDQYRITGVQESWFRRSAVIVDTAEEAMSDKVVELPNGVPRDFGGDQKEKYQGTDLCSICDRQFMDDVTQLKALRSYLIRQAKSPEPGTVELGDLNLLRFDEKGRYPTDAEWWSLEHRSNELYRDLSEADRRRFLYGQIPSSVIRTGAVLGAIALVALLSAFAVSLTGATII